MDKEDKADLLMRTVGDRLKWRIKRPRLVEERSKISKEILKCTKKIMAIDKELDRLYAEQ